MGFVELMCRNPSGSLDSSRGSRFLLVLTILECHVSCVMCRSGQPPCHVSCVMCRSGQPPGYQDTCVLPQLQSRLYIGWILYPDNGDFSDNCPKLLLCPQILQIKRNDYMQALVTVREDKVETAASSHICACFKVLNPHWSLYSPLPVTCQ